MKILIIHIRRSLDLKGLHLGSILMDGNPMVPFKTTSSFVLLLFGVIKAFFLYSLALSPRRPRHLPGVSKTNLALRKY